MLTGQRPFVSELPSEVVTMQVRAQARPLRELAPDVPADLAALVHRMLAKQPADRPLMAQVAEQLQPFATVALPIRAQPGAGRPARASTERSLSEAAAEAARASALPPVPLSLGGQGTAPPRARYRELVGAALALGAGLGLALLMQRPVRPNGPEIDGAGSARPVKEPGRVADAAPHPTQDQPQTNQESARDLSPAAGAAEAAEPRGTTGAEPPAATAAARTPPPPLKQAPAQRSSPRPRPPALLVPLFPEKPGNGP